MNFQFASIAAGLLATSITIDAAQASDLVGELLPPGYLSARGNQIVDAAGHKVRLACVAYAPQAGADVGKDMTAVKAYGFNCVRYPWYNATLGVNLATADLIVTSASAVGLKVILDHHADEAPSAANGYLSANCNGLPFDLGDGVNGDGCGDVGTVDRARFISDWVLVAKRYAGNAAVIGFDLSNEPHIFPAYWSPPGGATWGDGSCSKTSQVDCRDLRFLYAQAGAAIQAVNPGVLVICQGIQNWTANLSNGGSVTISGYPDLSLAGAKPVTLPIAGKIVYSVHDYPAEISGVTQVKGAVKVAAMNTAWGYLVSQRLAPVWVGEMGASLNTKGADTQTNGQSDPTKLADEQKWLAVLLGYLNGKDGAAGGPEFAGCQQSIGTDWWFWGDFANGAPDGTLNDNGQPRAAQQAATQQLAFVRNAGC